MRTIQAKKPRRGGAANPALPTAPSTGGRPSILTAALIEMVADSVRIGAHLDSAVGALGIAPRTAQRWISLARVPEHPEHRPEHLAFFEAVEKAQHQYHVNLASTLYRASRGLNAKGETAKFVGNVDALKFEMERGTGRRYWANRIEIDVTAAGVRLFRADQRPAMDGNTRGLLMPMEDDVPTIDATAEPVVEEHRR